MKKLTVLTAATLLALTACGDDSETAEETPTVQAAEETTSDSTSEDADKETKERPTEDETDDPETDTDTDADPGQEPADVSSISLTPPQDWIDISHMAPAEYLLALGSPDNNYNVLVRSIGYWDDFPGAEAIEDELNANVEDADITLVTDTADLIEFDVVGPDYTAVARYVNINGDGLELTLNGLNGHEARDHIDILGTVEIE